MDKSKVAVVEFFKANEEFAEAIEPAVRGLDDPASMFGRPAASNLALLRDASVVTPLADGIERRLAGVSAVGEQVHATMAPRSAHEGIEERFELRDIVSIGFGDANR